MTLPHLAGRVTDGLTDPPTQKLVSVQIEEFDAQRHFLDVTAQLALVVLEDALRHPGGGDAVQDRLLYRHLVQKVWFTFQG